METLNRLNLEELMGVERKADKWVASRNSVHAVVGDVVIGMMPRPNGYISIFCHPNGVTPRNVDELTRLGSYCGADKSLKEQYAAACKNATHSGSKDDAFLKAACSVRQYEIPDVAKEKERLNGLLAYVRNTLLN